MMVDPVRAIEWLKYDARTNFFINAIQYINWECIEGDILEFGVSVGKSLALLAQLYRENLVTWQYKEHECLTRRVAGFDTFTGIPPEKSVDQNSHPRWRTGSFGTNYLYGHPSLAMNEQITPTSIQRLFDACGLPRPELETGLFSETIPQAIPKKYARVALLHIDSDLYESAKCALEGVSPVLSDGALVCFDDWFMYRGDPKQGEARALGEFLEEHKDWQAIPYQTYSVFCNSFILRRR